MANDPLEQLIKGWEPKIRAAFTEAVKSLRDGVRLQRLVDLIRAGDVEGAIAEVGLDPARFRALDLQIRAAYESGGLDITAGIDRARRANVRPIFSPYGSGQRWITDHTVNLITEVTEDQRVLIRQTLGPLASGTDAMLTGNTPQKLALDLVGRVNKVTGRREGGLLGLTSGQAQWARGFEGKLTGVPDPSALTMKLRDRRFDKAIRKAIETETPLDPKTRVAAVNAYRNRALRFRAGNIADNEAHAVLLQAQQDAWSQAIERGVVEERAVRRFWIDAGDGRVRPEHAAVAGMNPKGVGLREPFQTPKGPAMNPGWAFDPGCRCRVRVRVLED